MARKTNKNGIDGLHEVKGAGFKATKSVKRDKTVNRRAGLHDKIKNLQGETRVKRCKPLALKHVRRMRKLAAVASVGVVGAVAVFGVGFLMSTKDFQLDGDFETVCYVAPTDGTKPTDHTLVENVGYMNYVLQHQSFWSSRARTDVDAVALGVPAKQSVDNYKQYYNDVLISADCAFSSVSKLLQYGEQFCQTKGVVLSRYSTSSETADLEKGMDAPWSTEPANGWTLKGFRSNRGFPPYEFSVYVLNELTIANAYDYTVVDNYDGTYSMSLTLNTNTGVDETSADYYYRLQMQKNGGLNDLPTIYWTTLTYTFDQNWRVLKLEVNDSYTAKAVGMNSECTSHTETNYDYAEENAKNTFWEDYFKGEYERLKDSLSDESVDKEKPADNAFNYLSTAFGSVLTDGAVFKVDLNIDNLDLNGVVNVQMENGGLSGLSAKLGDILVWLDGNTIYLNYGVSKYKLNTDGLLSSDAETVEEGDGQSPAEGLDLNALLEQLTSGEFALNEETGVATLNTDLELFGLKISLAFEFQKTEDGVDLNFLKAEIPLGEKVVKAKLCFGNKSDKPAVPADTKDYQDILNDGVTLNIALNANNFTLDGIAKIIMKEGAFAGVYAGLGEIAVYYGYPRNMLYLSVGNDKFKLDISKLNGGSNGLSADLGSFDAKTLLGDILANLSTSESSLGSSLNIKIDALGKLLKAALSIQLKGGLAVDADITFDKLNVNLTATLTNGEVELPDVSTGYQDILNSDITLDVSLTLKTGLTDEVTLNGKVALCLDDGAIREIRADFGSVAVYFELDSELLFIKVGTTKVMINAAEADLSGVSALSSLGSGGNFIDIDLPDAVAQLLNNLVTDSKMISTGLTLKVLSSNLPVWAKLDLSDGLSVSAGLSLLGIDAEAQVKFSDTALEGLSAEEKEEYTDVLKDTWSFVDKLFGDHISATVKGKQYSYEEKYADLNNVKYDFKASLEYDNVAVTVNEDGVEVDSNLYLHLNIGLTAQHADDDSLYLNLYILDANPATGKDGTTTGGYTTDGKLDIYLSVSKYKEDASSLMIYAPVDEVLTLVSMVGAMANLNDITVENSKELTASIGEISKLLDGMLISKYLSAGVQDKFASLGDSLIPQILGVSLEELLNKLIGNVEEAADKAQNVNFSLATEYVSSIKTTDNSLKFVLNSSAIYNKEIDTEENLTVEFTRVNKDGVYFVDGVTLNNIYFGENEINKLDLGLTLGYDEIKRPDAKTAFKDYFNADGLDDLLNAVINSATHSSEKMDAVDKILYAGAKEVPQYLLNHDYYISGEITMEVLGKSVPITVNGLSAHIDENNDVSINASLFIPKTKVLGITAVSNNTNLELTIKDGLIYLKRTVGSSVEYRIMTLDAFLKDIMNQIKFMFNLSSFINSIMDSATGSGNKTPLTFDDYGDYISKLISHYRYDAGKNIWDIALNGTSIGGLAGIDLSDINITIGADKSLTDGSLMVNNLGLGLTMFNVIKISGNLNYINPQYKWVNNADKSSSTKDLAVSSEKALGGLSWTEVLTGKSYNEVKADILEKDITFMDAVKAHTDWAKLTSYLATNDYLRFGNGINLSVGSMQYLIEKEVGGNIGYQSFMDSVNVLYYGSNFFTYCETDVENIKAVAAGKYSDLDRYDELKYSAYEGEFKYEYNFKESEYDRVSVILVSNLPVNGFTAQNGNYERELSFVPDCHVELSDMNNINAYKFGGFYSDAEFKNEITEFTATEGLRIYVKWIPKEVEITYVSDVEYSCEYDLQEINGTEYYAVSTAAGAMNFDNVTVSGAFGNTQNLTFLGWFAQLPDGTYKYVADAAGLRTVIDGLDFVDSDKITIELFAVWECDYTLKATYAQYAYKGFYGEFTVRGKFNLTYNSELSLEILNNSDVAVKTYLTYGSGNNSKMSDTYENEVEFDYSTIDLTHKCAAINGYGWLTVKVAYVQNGNEIKSTSKTDHVQRS